MAFVPLPGLPLGVGLGLTVVFPAGGASFVGLGTGLAVGTGGGIPACDVFAAGGGDAAVGVAAGGGACGGLDAGKGGCGGGGKGCVCVGAGMGD